MRFHIKRLFIWFSKEDEPRVLKFENNKVNVITGDSSTGKSNILAIIDYCLLSDNPKIVYPVINEFAEWYGLEFEVDGKVMHIARKKPTEETSASELVMKEGVVEMGYYPTSNNIHLNDARRQLDLLFGLRQSVQRRPGVRNEDNEDLEVSYRSFLIYNAITEGIMSSPYIFTDVNFFDSKMTKSLKGQRYLFDTMLGINNAHINELKTKIEGLENKKEEKRKNENKISKKTGAYKDKLAYLKSLCQKNDVFAFINDPSLTDDEIIERLSDLVAQLAPKKNDDGQDLETLMAELNQKVMLLDNMKRAKREYEVYLEQLDSTVDKLKPIEYLKERLDEMGVSEWTSYILESFQISLKKLQTAEIRDHEKIVTQKTIDEMENYVTELRKRVLSLERTMELSIEKNNNLFYVVGVLQAELPKLEELKAKIPVVLEEFTEQDEVSLNACQRELEQLESDIVRAYYAMDEVFNEVYGTFHYMEYYKGCKPKYNKKDLRLELNNGKSIINYNNVGSQSNYMFLHLCFFLGIHRYLAQHPNQHIGQFLFIDQPSIPYYSGGKEVKTTDEAKLKDAFASINTFMENAIREQRSEFQVIMIEHAPVSYWADLDYFNTTEEFIEGNALIPKRITETKQI